MTRPRTVTFTATLGEWERRDYGDGTMVARCKWSYPGGSTMVAANIGQDMDGRWWCTTFKIDGSRQHAPCDDMEDGIAQAEAALLGAPALPSQPPVLPMAAAVVYHPDEIARRLGKTPPSAEDVERMAERAWNAYYEGAEGPQVAPWANIAEGRRAPWRRVVHALVCADRKDKEGGAR